MALSKLASRISAGMEMKISHKHPIRSGLTLVELLVVLITISISLTLLLTAVLPIHQLVLIGVHERADDYSGH